MCIKGISVRSFFTVDGTHSGTLSKGKMTLGALAVAGLVATAVGAAGIFGTGLAKVAAASLNTRIGMTVGGAVTTVFSIIMLFLSRKKSKETALAHLKETMRLTALPPIEPRSFLISSTNPHYGKASGQLPDTFPEDFSYKPAPAYVAPADDIHIFFS